MYFLGQFEKKTLVKYIVKRVKYAVENVIDVFMFSCQDLK